MVLQVRAAVPVLPVVTFIFLGAATDPLGGDASTSLVHLTVSPCWSIHPMASARTAVPGARGSKKYGCRVTWNLAGDL